MKASSPVPDRFQELHRIKEKYVGSTFDWYARHRFWPRVGFRGAGAFVILGTLSLPVIALLGGKGFEHLTAIIAVAVAVVTSLNAFFNWQKTWEKRIKIYLRLEGEIAIWETKFDQASKEKDEDIGYRNALLATQELIRETQRLTGEETTDWFSDLRFPESNRERKVD